IIIRTDNWSEALQFYGRFSTCRRRSKETQSSVSKPALFVYTWNKVKNMARFSNFWFQTFKPRSENLSLPAAPSSRKILEFRAATSETLMGLYSMSAWLLTKRVLRLADRCADKLQ